MCDFLLVFYSYLRSRWNSCRVISSQTQQTVIPNKKNKNKKRKDNVAKYPISSGQGGQSEVKELRFQHGPLNFNVGPQP